MCIAHFGSMQCHFRDGMSGRKLPDDAAQYAVDVLERSGQIMNFVVGKMVDTAANGYLFARKPAATAAHRIISSYSQFSRLYGAGSPKQPNDGALR